MSSTTFTSGTVIASTWLNDVNNAVYNTVPSQSSAAGISYAPSGTGAVTTTVQAKLQQTISVKDFGAIGNGTTDDTAAIQAAINAVPVGGWLVIPASANPYLLNISLQTGALLVNKRMTIVFEGDVKSASPGVIGANPQTLFNVTGDNVSFIGTGKIIGDGTTDSTNAGDSTTTPSLVRVTGNYFRMEGLTIVTPWKTGLFLYGSSNSIISNNKFTGGPTTYTDTGYFGIYLVNGGNHIVSGNQFYPDSNGGMYVQCVFTSGANTCSFTNNIAIKPYEKIFYINSSDNVVESNTCIGNSGTIPGTMFIGTMSDSIRVSGSRNSVRGNYLNYTSGISSHNGGTANTISGNTLLNCVQGGISIDGGSVALDNTVISDNTCVCGNFANAIVQDGIYINAATGTNYYLRITNNTVDGFSPVNPIGTVVSWTASTAIPYRGITKPSVDNGRYYLNIGSGTTGGTEPTWPTTPGATVVDGSVTWTCYAYATNVTAQCRIVAASSLITLSNISENILSTGNIGLSTTYLDNSQIANNQIKDTLYPISESNGTTLQYRFNLIQGPTGAIGINGLGATCNGQGNTYQKTALSTVSTATASVNTYTVSSIVAATNAYVQVTPVNATGATFIKSHGVYAVQSSPNIQVTSGDGTNFAGTEQFLLTLIQ